MSRKSEGDAMPGWSTILRVDPAQLGLDKKPPDDEGTQHDGGRQPDRQRSHVGQTPRLHHQQHEGGRHGAEVGLSEVDDPVRPPDERHAQRDERTQQADDEARREGADRHREHQGREPEDERGRQDRAQPRRHRAVTHDVVGPLWDIRHPLVNDVGPEL